MKQANFCGRVGGDAETRTVGDNTVTNFNLAINRVPRKGEKQAPLWIRACFWGNRGEKVAPYITKGSMVAISGDIDLETYEGKNGDVTQIVCRVNDLTLCGGGEKEAEQPAF